MNARIAASAVRITGRARCTVASTTARNGSRPACSLWRICPIRISVLRIRMPDRAISPTSALMPNGCWNRISVGTTPISPSGLVRKTMTIAEIERTCRMMMISVAASMIGNSGSMALLALPDSSMAPASSMR
ncbi:hypothetical protein D3C75_740570 [compost metagenome]